MTKHSTCLSRVFLRRKTNRGFNLDPGSAGRTFSRRHGKATVMEMKQPNSTKVVFPSRAKPIYSWFVLECLRFTVNYLEWQSVWILERNAISPASHFIRGAVLNTTSDEDVQHQHQRVHRVHTLFWNHLITCCVVSTVHILSKLQLNHYLRGLEDKAHNTSHNETLTLYSIYSVKNL